MHHRNVLFSLLILTTARIYNLNNTEDAIRKCCKAKNSTERIEAMHEHCKQRIKDAGFEEHYVSCEMARMDKADGLTQQDFSKSTLLRYGHPKTRIYLNTKSLADNTQNQKMFCIGMTENIEHEMGHVQQWYNIYRKHGVTFKGHEIPKNFHNNIVGTSHAIDEVKRNNLPLLNPNEATNVEDDADLYALRTIQTPCLTAYALRKIYREPYGGYLPQQEKVRIAQEQCRTSRSHEALYKQFIREDYLKVKYGLRR